MNSVSTNIVKLDLDFLLDNCHRPALWGKKWTIFRYGDYEITFTISTIYVKSREMTYETALYVKGALVSTDANGGLPMDREHRNHKVLQRRINRYVVDYLIGWHEKRLIERSEDYGSIFRSIQARREVMKARAIELLDGMGIAHAGIREAYINAQKDKVRADALEELTDYMRGRVLTPLYLSYALFANDKELYDKYIQLLSVPKEESDVLVSKMTEELGQIPQTDMVYKIELDSIGHTEDE